MQDSPPPMTTSPSSFPSAGFSRSCSRSAAARDMPPPSYDTEPMRNEELEDALDILRKYDTVILVDDSSSMSLLEPRLAGQAFQALAETAQKYDKDGIDIYFLNSTKEALNMRSSADVKAVFNSIQPTGLTPTGKRLDQLLKLYLTKLESAEIQPDGTPLRKKLFRKEVIKPVNFIVITDGEATAERPNQLGIQFVQIGNDAAATRALKELDDDLHKLGDIQDIVDTTPYSMLNPVTADGLIKALLGGINRRFDKQNNLKPA
ncbi:hypothetical protein DFH09DRAFT_1115374 [Mycena vulgaris]|nr:hypothetical protein DFH09DRAFT_1115374 [Mycena vulgaris]